MSKLVDRTGERYSRLLVIKRAPNFICSSGREFVMWECKCDCGKIVNVSTNSLRTGATTSCGCWNREQQLKSETKHILHGDRSKKSEDHLLYEKWLSIKKRCLSSYSHNYENYGRKRYQNVSRMARRLYGI